MQVSITTALQPDRFVILTFGNDSRFGLQCEQRGLVELGGHPAPCNHPRIQAWPLSSSAFDRAQLMALFHKLQRRMAADKRMLAEHAQLRAVIRAGLAADQEPHPQQQWLFRRESDDIARSKWIEEAFSLMQPLKQAIINR